jgi:signal transduction histidine kinase
VVLFSLLTALVDMTSLIFFPVTLPTAWVGQTLIGPVFVRTGTFLFIGYMINQLVSAQRKQREELAQANAGLARYAVTLEQLATSRERNRVARELHDILAHTLSGMAIELEAVKKLWHFDPDKAANMLDHSLSSVREGLTESRRALQALRATPLEDLGLVFALRALAEGAAARGSFELDLDLPEAIKEQPAEVEQIYYRIAQEALTNVVEHACAKTVHLTLAAANGSLRLSIRDDGRGFDPQNIDAQRQYGLVGMKERAAMIGAALSVASQPGAGTAIECSLPAGETRKELKP